MQNKPNRFPIRKPGRWLAIAFGGLLLFRFCVYPFTPLPRWAEYRLSNRLDTVEGGEVEIVIPAQTGIGGSELSPDGRWAVWGSERREGEERSRLFIRDLTTGEDIDISDVEWRGEGRRWLADNRFIAKNHNRYWIVQLPGLEAQELNVIGEKQSMEQLAEEFALYNNVVAYKGFSISNSAVALIALDATPPLVYN